MPVQSGYITIKGSSIFFFIDIIAVAKDPVPEFFNP
jgi:hypothetical protein